MGDSIRHVTDCRYGTCSLLVVFLGLGLSSAAYPRQANQMQTPNERNGQARSAITDQERQQLLDRIEELERELAAIQEEAKALKALTQPAAHTPATPVARSSAGPGANEGSDFVSMTGESANNLAAPGTQTQSPGAVPQYPDQKRKVEHAPKAEPFAFADFTWLNGNSRTSESPLDTKVFTGEFRVDTSYIYDFNHPQDHTLVGTSESGRTNEFQVQQLGIGGDFHYDHIRGRLMTQFGMYSTMTPRNDPTPGRGQWNLADAYRYVSEAYGGYHFDVLHGINVDAGIFMSYIGLFSYYNFDNWAYQPSYVSSNTPWFFNGVRVQIFPTEKLKIEPWFVNGWQSYGTANGRPGFGFRSCGVPTDPFRYSATSTPWAETRWEPPVARAFTRTTASRSNTMTIRRSSSTRWRSR
jgi:hypothetical protein